MRGVLYRTESDGETPLAKPELKVSATKHNRVAYYKDELVKNEAFENGELKEGMIVMTAEDDLSTISSVPVATIITSVSDKAPSGYLLCDGNQYSQTTYPALYLAIGNKYNKEDTSEGYFCVPDLRELVLVGTGENDTQEIENHDVFELGEFKDDQLQEVAGTFSVVAQGNTNRMFAVRTTGVFSQHSYGTVDGYTGSAGAGTGAVMDFKLSNVARAGTTTRTKQFGVNYFIKATSGELNEDDGVTVNNIMRNIYPDWSRTTAFITIPNNGTWTAPADGWVTLNQYGTVTSKYIYINDILVARADGASVTNSWAGTVRKGDIFKFTGAQGALSFTPIN